MSTAPVGRHDRENDCSVSRINLPIRNRRKKYSSALSTVPTMVTGTLTRRLSTLVEKSSFCHPGLVLRCHLDIGRRQQEHLVRNTLDASMQAEYETCREVDQTFRVTVDHLGQIH